jgi:putative membrane protein
MLRWLLAAFHLLAFGIGLGAIWARAAALKSVQDPATLRRALSADAWWGVAAFLWIATGLFVLVFLLELGPIVTLMSWRRALARGATPDTHRAGRFAKTSRIQIVLLLAMLFAATAMARGYGSVPKKICL